MKKLFSLMLLLATVLMMLPACSDDKDDATYYVRSIEGNHAELRLTMGSESMEIRAVKR